MVSRSFSCAWDSQSFFQAMHIALGGPGQFTNDSFTAVKILYIHFQTLYSSNEYSSTLKNILYNVSRVGH